MQSVNTSCLSWSANTCQYGLFLDSKMACHGSTNKSIWDTVPTFLFSYLRKRYQLRLLKEVVYPSEIPWIAYVKAVLPVWLGVRIHVGKLSCSRTKTMLCLDPHFYQSKAPVYYKACSWWSWSCYCCCSPANVHIHSCTAAWGLLVYYSCTAFVKWVPLTLRVISHTLLLNTQLFESCIIITFYCHN